MSVGGFAAFSTILLVLKTFVAIQHSLTWYKRYRQLSSSRSVQAAVGGAAADSPVKRSGQNANRLPIVPFLSWMFVVDYLLFFALSGAGVVGVFNGGAAFLFGFGWLVFGLSSILFLMKFVTLGYRIAPRSKIFRTMKGVEKLTRLDTFGKFSLGLCVTALILQTIMFCVLPLIYRQDAEVYIRTGFGIEGYFVAQHAITIMYHFQRVKNMISSSRDANKEHVSSEKATQELNYALKKITEQQTVLGICALASVSSHIVVTIGIFPLHWFIPMIFMSIETTNFVFIVISDMRGKKQANARRKRDAQRQIDDRNGSPRAGSPTDPEDETGSGGSSANQMSTNKQQQGGQSTALSTSSMTPFVSASGRNNGGGGSVEEIMT